MKTNAIGNFRENSIPNQINNKEKINLQKKHEQLNNQHTNESNKITVKEGFILFGKGMINHIADMAKSIVKHPVKTAISVASTSMILFALPLVGIPTVTAASVMALGFAGFSVCKSIFHINQFINNNKNHDYEQARNNLSQLGCDTIDLAMSIPAVPKSIKQVSKFAKYGKVGINRTLINDLQSKSGISGKINAIKSSNNELIRSMNYQTEVDKAISKLSKCNDVQKAEIKKHLLEFNVPDEKIPEVVLKKYGEMTGVKTCPKIEYARFQNDNTKGMASGEECLITLKKEDADKIIPKNSGNGPNSSRFKRLGFKMIGNEYEYTYQDLKTGEKLFERVNKNIIEDYVDLTNNTKKLSPQANIISTTVHERRHIEQFAKILQYKGKNHFETTPEAAKLYSDMIAEMPAIKRFSPETKLIKSWISGSKGIKGLLGTYLSEPMEVDARRVQSIAVNHPEFKILDGIYKQMNNIVPEKILRMVLPNYVKAQSVVAQS